MYQHSINLFHLNPTHIGRAVQYLPIKNLNHGGILIFIPFKTRHVPLGIKCEIQNIYFHFIIHEQFYDLMPHQTKAGQNEVGEKEVG